MVHVSGDVFGSTIQPGKIYYFKSEQLTHTSEPHYFIAIAMPNDDIVIFSVLTSQFEKRKRFIELNNFPFSTLVWIKPDDENELKKNSYVDCNTVFKYSKEKLIQMYKENEITFIGHVLDSKFEEIKQGILDSPLITREVKNML